MHGNYLKYISANCLENLFKEDVLKGVSEKDKLTMIASWIGLAKEDEKATREGHFNNLISHLDFSKFSTDFMLDILTNEAIIGLPKPLM